MYEEQIARGIAVLNERRPSWRELIDMEQLDVISVMTCPVGQAYEITSNLTEAGRAWDAALVDLGAPRYDTIRGFYADSPTRAWAIDHGFETDGGYTAYEELTDEWRRALTSA